ncbi:MAG: hypothetical protein ACOCPS_00160 [Desulfonatronovibrio sp.]
MIMRNQNLTSRSIDPGLGPFELFVVGWRLILSEMGWFLKIRFRFWEIRQLDKRLNKEKINLAEQVQGKISGSKQVLDLKDPDIELTLGQVALLEEEISYLLEEIKAKRKIFVEKRRRKYLEKTD